MIELGMIPIKNETSIVEARNKIRLLAKDLKFDSIGATRLATITSELSRIIYQKSEDSSIVVGFDEREEGFGLTLVFQSKKEGLDVGKAEIFFDELDISRAEEGWQKVETFKYIPDPAFKPTEEFIETEKERLIRLSRAELLNEVKRKNEELSKLLDQHKQVEETLRELDRMKSEFISNVSHELRTPIHAIGGFAKLMLRGEVPDPETQKEFLSIIDERSQHLGALIESLLDMSRLESGRFDIQKQHLLIKDIIHEAIGSFYSLASEQGIVISEDIPATLPEVEADRERLGQVMANLLSNAIKFSDGGRSVIVKGGAKDGELVVQVTDHGIGIPKEAMPHLFERFYRAEDSMARGGAGLGLYISRQIIEAHGGRIWVESKVGKGTTVSFALPLNEVGSDSHE